jgi:hypothetical protein
MTHEVIVSPSRTRHIVGRQVHQFRISTLCRFGIRDEESLPLSEAMRDCEFCLAELADIEERRRKEAEKTNGKTI